MRRAQHSGGLKDLNEEVLLRGKAYICFSNDGAAFDGHVENTDHCQYGLVGHRHPDIDPRSVACLLTPDESCCGVYEMTVFDHEEGVKYILPQVVRVNGSSQGNCCALESEQVRFTAENSFRGHKADMLIQQYLSPRLLGNDLHVYEGDINIRYITESPRLRFLQGQSWMM